MILHCYDEGGLYLGPVAAALSPARPFVDGKPNYLFPARSTDQAPPEHQAGFVAVFDGTGWNQVEDHREQVIYSTESGAADTVRTVGPLPAGWTTTPRPDARHLWNGQGWSLDLELARTQMRAQRNALLDASDWTQLADSPLNAQGRERWAAYRQQLRDLPAAWTPETTWPRPPQE